MPLINNAAKSGPARPRNRPVIRCRHTPAEQPPPPPGTLAETTKGHVVMHVGQEWPSDQLDVPRLADQLRDAATVNLIGPAARRLKFALNEHWTEERRAAGAAAKALRPPVVAKAQRGVCGRPRRDGRPCQQAAGWGADPGEECCRSHGGSTVLRDQAARELLARTAEYMRLHLKARTVPLTLPEQITALTALRDAVAAQEQRRRRPG